MSSNIFGLASRHAEWVAHRRTVVAANVANANTPGYRSADVASFESTLDAGGTGLARTHERHLPVPQSSNGRDVQEGSAAAAQHSGNTVDLEQEMLRAGDVTRAHLLNVAIVKAFHRMSLSSAKG